MSSKKFLSSVEELLTKETRIASTQYDYILTWVNATSVDDLFINDVSINSDIIRAFAENIKKISDSGAFKIKKMEYEPKTKSAPTDPDTHRRDRRAVGGGVFRALSHR